MKPKALFNFLPIIAIATAGFLLWQRSQAGTLNERKVISAPTTHHQVAQVIDGETIVLENGEKVLFCGIKAPKNGQKLEPESTANLKRLIDTARGKVIVAEHERDRDGHIIGEVFAPMPNSQEEKLLNYEQVRSGFAYESEQSEECLNGLMLGDAEELAKSERRSVWKSRDDQRP